MTTNNASATTVTFIGGGSRKFYRVLVVGTSEIRQWGRLGTRGQSMIQQHSGVREAERSAEGQIQKKMAKGYGNRVDHTFVLPELTAMSKDKVIGIYEQSMLDGNEPEVVDALEDLERRAKNVVSLLATGSAEAYTEFTTVAADADAVTEAYERTMAFVRQVEIMASSLEEVDA